MTFIMQYIDALKNIKKRYYMTPFLLLVYFAALLNVMELVTSFINISNHTFREYFIFTTSLISTYALTILQVVLYPHASFYIQSTWLYRKIFKRTFSTLSKGFATYSSIGRNIPDDISFQDSRGRRYNARAGYKSKYDRVQSARANYSFFFILKFIVIDCILRLFVHAGIITLSPVIFLIAVPMLERQGILQNIEKNPAPAYDDINYTSEI